MSEQIKNSAASALAGSIGSGDGTLTVTTGQGANFPTAGNFRIKVENEIMICTSRTGDVLTVTRAAEGTSAAAHASGVAVTHILTAGGLTQLIADATGSTSLPTGAVVPYAATTAPTGWLVCDGSAASRTTYATLFALIGTTYGAGDGSTTFNLPDLRGRMPVGYAASGHADVATIAGTDGSALAARRPKHKHNAATTGNATDNPIGGSTNAPGSNSLLGGQSTGSRSLAVTATTTVGPQTGNEPTDAPAYIVLQYIIKT